MQNAKIEFQYLKRYTDISLKQWATIRINQFKRWLFLALAATRYKKRLFQFDFSDINEFDGYEIKKSPNLNGATDVEKQSKYCAITLPSISFFEAIDIDNFDHYAFKVISKFSSKSIFSNSLDRELLKKTLSSVKSQLDQISSGPLFNLDFSKEKGIDCNLLRLVDISYIKTNESYFIINMTVTPSVLFSEIFEKIVENRDMMKSQSNYYSLLEIMRKGRFIKSTSMINSVNRRSIENLVSDLNFQIKKNITRHLNGIFHKRGMIELLPLIEYYEVGNINEFRRDLYLKGYFESGFDGPYRSADTQIEIFINEFSPDILSRVQIVKEKGHGLRNDNSNDLTNYDGMEAYYLIKSLTFPCLFAAILKITNYELNKIKRALYDFIKSRSDRFIYRRNIKYIKLKLKFVLMGLTLKRFENEFSTRNILYYSSAFSLKEFLPSGKTPGYKNILERHIKIFANEIKILDRKMRDTNEIFKPVEELNIYKTNLYLQVFSALITLLAIALTFEKIKYYFVFTFEWLKSLF